MNIKLFFLCLSLTLIQNAPAEEQCFSGPYQLFDKFENIFVKGTFLPFRQIDGNTSSVIGLKVKSVNQNKAFTSAGIQDGTMITAICGISVSELFQSSKQHPVCCKSFENGKLPIVVSNSLLEIHTVLIDLNDSGQSKN